MDLQLIIGLLIGVLSLAGVTVAIARYFTKNQQQLDMLRGEIQTLQDQNKSIRATVTQLPSTTSVNAYQDLTGASEEAAKAVKADMHSISVPASLEAPSHLRIIHSTDTKSAQIQGMEFPITKSIAGWAFQYQQPHIKNDVYTDDRHFDGVDKAIGSRTGAMLTLPLISGGRCHGVIQFIKQAGGAFNEDDISIVSRYVPAITRKVIDLEESPREDIPTIARGNIIKASILFSDIRAFSDIAKRTSHMVTVSLLNEYYSRLLPIALSRRGSLQEYVGDGLYISFMLDSPAASARVALLSAFEMQKEFDNILNGWRDYGHPTSSVNAHCIGIATGSIYSGLMGYQKERRDKLVGPTVNLAAHICEAAKSLGGGVLIDQETYNLVSVDGYDMRPVNIKHDEKDKCYQVLKQRAYPD
jgi:class 3 adenylate cyclase